ncbi:MAG TPA: pyridoxamine 5'-phosphate oxidase family protein [Acidimicrobiia bacterium]|nr:pyridoxamine 5-phosphate oxidase [Acidimicrobiia bacterium]HYJ25966.1 pyridoxamine 5'-phosphate oxidase family protein [Acidimicrobiia bacterium]
MEPIDETEALEFLRDAMVAHLGVIDDGKPYVTPMSFVLDGRRLLFRTKPGKRFEAIEDNPRVCVEVSRFDDESGDWVSVVVNGTAIERTDEPTTSHAVEMLLEKYAAVLGSPLGTGGLQPMASFPHVVEVSIDEISGMSSGRGFSYRTRPGRL